MEAGSILADRPLARAAEVDVPSWRAVVTGPAIGLAALVWAYVATHRAGVPLRDPDHVAGRRMFGVLALIVGLVVVDVVVRAAWRSPRHRPTRAALSAVRRERWGWRRGLIAAGALVGFYASYFAYRNLKSVVPLLRPGDLFDHQLGDIDHVLFLGNDPGNVLHALFGMGEPQTQLMSTVYIFYVLFVPLLVGLTLVFARSQRQGLFLVAAMSLNWPLGALSYLLLPTLGPVYAKPGDFHALPGSGAGDLQHTLLHQRHAFLVDPHVAGRAQDIAAFASLHVSMLLTIALAAAVLRLDRRLRVTLWVLLGLSTLSTLYLGWHYAVDDVAGAAIGVAALVIARALTGYDPRYDAAGAGSDGGGPVANRQASGRSRAS